MAKATQKQIDYAIRRLDGIRASYKNQATQAISDLAQEIYDARRNDIQLSEFAKRVSNGTIKPRKDVSKTLRLCLNVQLCEVFDLSVFIPPANILYALKNQATNLVCKRLDDKFNTLKDVLMLGEADTLLNTINRTIELDVNELIESMKEEIYDIFGCAVLAPGRKSKKRAVRKDNRDSC